MFSLKEPGIVQVHSLEDGRLIKEVTIPSPLNSYSKRLIGHMVVPLWGDSFDVLAEREVKLPSPGYWPMETDSSLVFFTSRAARYRTRLLAYDREAGKIKYEVDLPFAPYNHSMHDNQLSIASAAHGVSVVTLNADTGQVIHHFEPYGGLSRSSALLALCIATWSVVWIAYSPTGRPWLDASAVVAVIVFGLIPYSVPSQAATILLVFSGFAVWQGMLKTDGRIDGILLCLTLAAPGWFLLSFHVPEQSLYPFQLLVWILLIAATTTVWRMAGYRLVKNSHASTDAVTRFGIGHMMMAITIVAVWTMGLRDYNMLMLERVSKVLPVAVAGFGLLFPFCCWLGARRPRWLSPSWEAMFSVGLVCLVVMPRVFELWYGYSAFDWIEGRVRPASGQWFPVSLQLRNFTGHSVETLWESISISLVGPYLLGITFRHGGFRLADPSEDTETARKPAESRQARALAGE